MKKFTIGFLVLVLVTLSTVFALAQKREGKGRHGHRGFARIAEKLNLTDAQKEQVKQILETSRAKVQPLKENMKANRRQLQELTANGQFDEAQVQAIAAQQGAIAAQMIVEKERAKSQIFQILTTEQQAQAKQMKEQVKERFKDKAKKFGGEDF